MIVAIIIIIIIGTINGRTILFLSLSLFFSFARKERSGIDNGGTVSAHAEK